MNSVQELLQQRYYHKGEDKWEDVANRVANFLFPDSPAMSLSTEVALNLKTFVPSSPVLMNAGSAFPMMCSCFVLPVSDDIKSIMKSLSDTVFIQKYGGGVGLNFSAIRPEGSVVRTTGGSASGPVSFMGFWNEAMNVIRQGGKRQGAMMGVLDWTHPDIDMFINAKQHEGALTNFNLSVGLDEEFWRLIREGDMEANRLFDDLARHAWENGEPGFLFLDNINAHNPYGIPIRATNPCGEVPLPPYGACCLGSINLNAALESVPGSSLMQLDYYRLQYLTRLGVDILNAVIDKTMWPIPEAGEFMSKYRPIGLGVMGLADMLARMGMRYDSMAARLLVDEVMFFIRTEAEAWSVHQGHVNSTLLSVAPTGSIAMIADASYSIEPYFHISGTKSVEAGTYETSQRVFEEVCEAYDVVLSKEDKEIIKESGSVQDTSLPTQIRNIFKIANEIAPEDHLAMQAVVQSRADNAVSKTINLPTYYAVEDIKQLIVWAHAHGIKGLTVYRDKSREIEVFTAGCPTGTCPL